MSAITGIVGSQQISALSSTGVIDPYAIFQLNFASLGGEDRVKNSNTSHLTGEVKVGTSTYDYEEWNRKPTMSCKEYSLYDSVVYKSGDSGKTLWVKSNGKVNTVPDEDTPERLIREGFEDYDYTDPNARFFRIKSSKTTRIDGKKCYEIVIKNTKTDEIRKQYYDSEEFLLRREIKETEGTKSQTDYDDYRDVNGVKMAFEKTFKNIDADTKEEYKFSEIIRNGYVSKAKMKVPSSDAKATTSTSSTTGTNVDTYA